MAIKNWTVKAQAVTGGGGGLAAYGRYLEDAKHRNHAGKTEAITPIISRRWNSSWKNLLMRQVALMTERNLNNPRGGRPVETLAQSFVVSLPRELRPTPEQWSEIALSALRGIQRGLPPDQRLEAEDLFVNAHENTSNPHLNILIGKLTSNHVIRKSITQKSALARAKTAVNEAVLRVMGVSNENYEPRAPRRPTQAEREAEGDYHKRNLTRWQYERLQREIEERIENRVEELNEMEQGFEALHSEFTTLETVAAGLGRHLDVVAARRARGRAAEATHSGELSDMIPRAPTPAAPQWRRERDAEKPWRPRPKRDDSDNGPSGP